MPLLPGAPERAAAPRNGNGGPCPKCGKHHQAEGAPAQPASKGVGEPVPEIQLRDLSGEEISLKKDFKAEETLVLFWNPGCSFCQKMLPDLKEWEAHPPEKAPKLLLVSAGSEEANEEIGLSSSWSWTKSLPWGALLGLQAPPPPYW